MMQFGSAAGAATRAAAGSEAGAAATLYDVVRGVSFSTSSTASGLNKWEKQNTYVDMHIQ